MRSSTSHICPPLESVSGSGYVLYNCARCFQVPCRTRSYWAAFYSLTGVKGRRTCNIVCHIGFCFLIGAGSPETFAASRMNIFVHLHHEKDVEAYMGYTSFTFQ